MRKGFMKCFGYKDLENAPEQTSVVYSTMVRVAAKTFWQKGQSFNNPIYNVAFDPKDEGTPDAWVKRSRVLIRLSGRHPMTCEPPVPLLIEAGTITPASILFVRSHGACVKSSWEGHRLIVEGSCERKTFKMDEIQAMEPRRTIHVTLQCAGNRCKELNMIKQTIGLQWANGGVGAPLCTGVPLHEFLKRCGVTEVTEERKFVWFNGPKGESSKGEDGSFGACLPLSMCLDPAKEVMLCWEMNGQLLTPDHGFPLRLVVPGWVGGRWTKWLSRITIAKEFSTNWFVDFDNKIFPTYVTEDMFWGDEKWGKSREFDYTELNLQSTITSPAHDEVVAYRPEEESGTNKTYTMRGYAYTGGGRPVTRVEVSLDGARTWRLATLPQQEPTEYSNIWAWYLWSCEVTVKELAEASELVCRAWDFASNTQCERPIWNVMGMANHCLFRVRPRRVAAEGGVLCMYFEHPTQPGASNKGGWMGCTPGGYKVEDGPEVYDRTTSLPFLSSLQAPSFESFAVVDQSNVLLKSLSLAQHPSLTSEEITPSGPLVTLAELEKHNTPEDCWIAIHGKVYNCNSYLAKHPGGSDAITIAAGTDCTDDFEAIHSNKAYKLLEPLYVGDLDLGNGSEAAWNNPGSPVTDTDKLLIRWNSQPHKDFNPNIRQDPQTVYPTTQSSTESSDIEKRMLPLDPRKGQEFHLVKKTEVNCNTRILTFERNNTYFAENIPIPVGQRIIVMMTVKGKLAMRAYSPWKDGPGFFELLIKVGAQAESFGCPEESKFSGELDTLKLGERVMVKGPVGRLIYHGRGNYSVGKHEYHAKKIGMFATHTGIIPLWHMIKDACLKRNDNTEFYLVYHNKVVQDFILLNELQQLRDSFPAQCHFTFSLDVEPHNAQMDNIFVIGKDHKSLILRHFPRPREGIFESSIFFSAPQMAVEENILPLLKMQDFRMHRVLVLL